MKKQFILLLLLVTATFSSLAQKYDLGKVTIEELSEKSHPKDSSAAAAILFRKGDVQFEFSPQNGFEMVTTIKTKIKIYKKEGYDWANQSQRVYIGGNSSDESANFKNAVTYNLVDGKIEKTKLKSDGEFTEKVNKFWNVKKITMPNVKEGSIIEYESVLRSVLISTIDKFDFQASIPINYSEYRTCLPEYFVYNPNQKGYIFPTMRTEQSQKTVAYTTKERSEGRNTRTTFSQEELKYMETRNTYTIQDVPALKDESFVNNINNYTSSISHELSMTRYPNQPYKNFSTDWESVTKTIYDSENFGSELSKTGYFENDIDLLIKGAASQKERIALIFNFVKSKVKWNEYHGYFCDNGVRKAYKDMTGNVAEINLMLVAMLRYAGVEANPVLISTRSNGIPLFPNRTAFNYVIAGVEMENNVVLMDATDKNSLPNILPLRDLNWNGRIIRKNGTSSEIDLTPGIISTDQINVIATISKEAVIEGKLKEQYLDYNGYMHRNRFGNVSEDNYLESLEKKHKGLEISEYKISGIQELDKPVVESYSFRHNNIVEAIGDKMYFSPLLFFVMDENPFKQEKREYPVDFSYPNEDKYLFSITIPDGYVVESLPKSGSIGMTGDSVSLKYMVANTDNKIQVSVKFNINSSIIPPDDYEQLKAVFTEIVKKQNEKIVLKKA